MSASERWQAVNDLHVIIPSKNSADTLADCLRAVCAQIHPSQVTVVDNNSTDGSDLIARDFGCRVLHQKTPGPAATRNLGWQNTEAGYIAFIDADVIIGENWLERMLAFTIARQLVASQSAVIPLGEKRARFIDRFRREWKLLRTSGSSSELESLGVINTAACLYSRKVLELTGGFDESFRRLEDFELSMRVRFYGASATCPGAKAFVRYSRNTLQYFLRSFFDGVNFEKIRRKWPRLELMNFETVTNNFQLVEGLRFMFFEVGRFYERCTHLHTSEKTKC